MTSGISRAPRHRPVRIAAPYSRRQLLMVLAEEWLASYTQANPTRSMYAFCINRQYPGYFILCFKAGRDAKPQAWPIKVIPNAFELMKNPYPDMKALRNGFKTIYMHQSSSRGQGHAGVPGPGIAMGAAMNARALPVRR